MRQIDTIVIHCSDTPNGRWVTVDDIDVWHEQRGFRRNVTLMGRNQPRLKHIGYHFVIYAAGAVIIGRGLDEVGAHVKNHNLTSVGICMIGRDQFDLLQWAALRKNVLSLLETFPGARIVGHRDLSPDLNGNGVIEQVEHIKKCPCFDVSAWLAGNMQPLDGHIFNEVA